MNWLEMTQRELEQARRELAAAEDGLAAGTQAAHNRYARALHEVDRAEHQSLRGLREGWQSEASAAAL